MSNNPFIKKVIKEVAKELNLPEAKVKHAVNHFFLWQRHAFDSLKYSKYLWNYFGTFTIIKKRYEGLVKSDKFIPPEDKLTNKNNNKNNNDE